MLINCRFCEGTNCETADDCADCGCPSCHYPGALYEGRGFCPDCEWEATPGAAKAWMDAHPITQPIEKFREFLGLPADVVGAPVWDTTDID
jgi:hypothetical protein